MRMDPQVPKTPRKDGFVIASHGADRRGSGRGNLGSFVVPLLGLLLITLTSCAPIRQRTGYIRDGGDEPKTRTSSKTDVTKASVPTGSADGASAALSTKKSNAWEDEMEGLASWYGQDFNGHLTASGEVYDMYEMTAAHKTLPLQTVVKVHNLETGKNITVRINDRGPYVKGRVIDLSRKAARALGMREEGTAKVKLEV